MGYSVLGYADVSNWQNVLYLGVAYFIVCKFDLTNKRNHESTQNSDSKHREMWNVEDSNNWNVLWNALNKTNWTERQTYDKTNMQNVSYRIRVAGYGSVCCKILRKFMDFGKSSK